MKNKRPLVALVLVAGLTLAAAAILSGYRGNKLLEEPGLRLVNLHLYNENGQLARTNSVYFPENLPGYSSELLPITSVELDFLPADTLFGRRIYQSVDGFQCQVNAVLMGTDRTSIHKPQYCLAGQGFKIDLEEEARIQMTEPISYALPVMKITTTRLVRGGDGQESPLRGIYVYWFVCRDAMTASHGERMYAMAKDLLLDGNLQRWAYVSYFAVCRPGQEEDTYQRMTELIQRTVPHYQIPPRREGEGARDVAGRE